MADGCLAPAQKKPGVRGAPLSFSIRVASCSNPRCAARGHPRARRPSTLVGTATTVCRWTAAITVSPVRQRVGLYFSIAPSNITGDDVFAFVQHLHGHLKRPLLVIWDRFSGHKKAARLLTYLYGTRMQVEFLPAYAPELNVVEQCWGHTTYGEIANFMPHDLNDLAREVAGSLLAKHQRPDLLRAFFQHAQLRL